MVSPAIAHHEIMIHFFTESHKPDFRRMDKAFDANPSSQANESILKKPLIKPHNWSMGSVRVAAGS
jgi:hypothetical protein